MRLDLEPLRSQHAAEMAEVLAAPELYRFTGGAPPSVAELRERYARQVRGRSPDGTAQWRNWIVRAREAGRAVGFIQATITGAGDARVAELAWTIGVTHQGQGYAQEAAAAAVARLRAEGVAEFTAHIAPGHTASEAVARRLGMSPINRLRDGEALWRAPA